MRTPKSRGVYTRFTRGAHEWRPQAGRTPKDVFKHHAEVLAAGDLEGIVSDYAESLRRRCTTTCGRPRPDRRPKLADPDVFAVGPEKHVLRVGIDGVVP
jgi:hypothetical protein